MAASALRVRSPAAISPPTARLAAAAARRAGDAKKVSVTNTGNIYTGGTYASGIFAQSVGGGGGNGGFAAGASFATSGEAKAKVGGGGAGTAVTSGLVMVTSIGSIQTIGDSSDGIFAQSVGGGGVSGGFAVSAGFFVGKNIVTSSAVGGGGGAGGMAGVVMVTQTGDISHGGSQCQRHLRAVGHVGGGGNGGFSAGGAFSVKGDATSTVGGAGAATGGLGSDGKAVTVTANGFIQTSGAFRPMRFSRRALAAAAAMAALSPRHPSLPKARPTATPSAVWAGLRATQTP